MQIVDCGIPFTAHGLPLTARSVLPVPGIVPGSLPALPVPGIVPGSLSNGSKGSPFTVYQNKKLHPSWSHSAERREHSENKTKKKSPTPLVVRIAQSAESIAIRNLENKKLQSPPNEEMELSQRTGQLLIVCVLGRGNPLGITLAL